MRPMREIVRNAILLLVLILSGMALLVWLGDDPSTLPFAYEGHGAR